MDITKLGQTCSILTDASLNLVNFPFVNREPAARTLWESLMNLKQKEGLMEVRRHLVEAASRENLPIKMSMGEPLHH